MAARSLQTPTMPTTRRRGFGSGRDAPGERRRRSEMPPCRFRTSTRIWMSCKNAVLLFSLRARAGRLNCFCLEGTAESPGPGTAVRRPYGCSPDAAGASRCHLQRAHRVSADAARRGSKTGVQSILLTARKGRAARPRAPTRRQRAHGTFADALPRFRNSPCAASTTARRHAPLPRPQQRAHGKTERWAPTSGQRD